MRPHLPVKGDCLSVVVVKSLFVSIDRA